MATSLDEETTKKVIRQVEFYFSDSNLPRDNFLKSTIADSEDGMVSLALICSFSRMRGHLGLGDVKVDEVSEETVKLVAEALKTSTSLKISEDGKKVGRTTELLKPDEVIEQVDSRTIAAAPLPFDVKVDELEAFFGQFAKVNSLRLPRHVAEKRVFSGTALIEFSTEEEAENVLKQSLTYAGAELELHPKKDYDVERENSAAEFENYRPHMNSNGKNTTKPEDNYPKGLIVAFSLKKHISVEKSSEPDNKVDSAADGVSGDAEKKDGEIDGSAEMNVDSKSEGTGEEKNGAENEGSAEDKDNSSNNEEKCEGEEKKGEEKTEGEEQKSEEKPKAADYVKNMDVVMREDLKKVFQKYGTVKFIDFKIGEESGYVRFEDPSGSQKARAAAVLADEGGLTVKNFIAVLEPLSGDAEKEYWSALRSNQDKARDNKGGGRGRGGRFNRGGKNFRPRDNDYGNGRHNKAQKV
uniref:La protein 1 n=1 Tax=Kalanchoe fedtschenkoi TaxID=63787 RepID=A0A7N0U9C1_KALFE